MSIVPLKNNHSLQKQSNQSKNPINIPAYFKKTNPY